MRRRSPQQTSKCRRRKERRDKGRFVLSVFFTLPIQIRSWSLRRRFPAPHHRRYAFMQTNLKASMVLWGLPMNRFNMFTSSYMSLWVGAEHQIGRTVLGPFSSFMRPALHLVARTIVLDRSSSLKAVDGLYLEGQERSKDPKDK
ncbi:hypothetical protein NL676_037156 [Syzygium grande]|nr:hypothetical protein NL676_037156 [Syzygium grande]